MITLSKGDDIYSAEKFQQSSDDYAEHQAKVIRPGKSIRGSRRLISTGTNDSHQ